MSSPSPVPLSPEGRLRLERSLLPLPQEVSASETIALEPAAIGLCADPQPDDCILTGLDHLRGIFRERTGELLEGEAFTIYVGLVDEAGAVAGRPVRLADRLAELPNREQAYVIETDATGMTVAGLAETGVTYGLMTLCQILEMTPVQPQLELPLITIVDWPALAERGFWHMPLNESVWLASMKINRIHSTTRFCVSPAGQLVPFMSTNIDDEAESAAWERPFEQAGHHGLKVIPGIAHLDFWEAQCPGFAAAYPELIGQGEAAKAGGFPATGARVPCASNPRLIDCLATLMARIAEWGVPEICVWTSEYPGGQCSCADCTRECQFQAEVRAILTAWGQVRERHAELGLRIFFGAGGFAPGEKWYPDYPPEAVEDILDTLPPEVCLEVSNGFEEAVLAEYASGGGKVVRFYVTVPSFWDRYAAGAIRDRLRLFAANGYLGACQYFPDYYREEIHQALQVQLCAYAEYSWNPEGRDPIALAEAWAARQGIDEPERFGQWVYMMTERGVARDEMEKFLSANPEIKARLEERYRFPG